MDERVKPLGLLLCVSENGCPLSNWWDSVENGVIRCFLSNGDEQCFEALDQNIHDARSNFANGRVLDVKVSNGRLYP